MIGSLNTGSSGSKKRGAIARFLMRVDWMLLGIVCLIAGVGIANLYSAHLVVGKAYHVSQSIAFVVGLGIVAVMGAMHQRLYERWAYVAYAGVVVLLFLVSQFGVVLNGSRRWLNLGVFLLQPSELLKIAVILITARYFHDHERDERYSIRSLLKIFGLVGFGVLFVLMQPDLGTSLCILAIFATMALFEGVKTSSLIILATTALLSLPFAWTFGLEDYQKGRVITFLNIEEGQQHTDAWQVRQSIIAFGSGKVWGKGYTQGTQIQKGFVPEHENDFAAAVWAEEQGFLGMLFLLAAYLSLLLWSLRIAWRATDRFGVHIAIGMTAFFFWHIVVNLGMVSGMLPVVGLPLPLMSYGRSSLMTVMFGLGLLMSVSVSSKPS